MFTLFFVIQRATGVRHTALFAAFAVLIFFAGCAAPLIQPASGVVIGSTVGWSCKEGLYTRLSPATDAASASPCSKVGTVTPTTCATATATAMRSVPGHGGDRPLAGSEGSLGEDELQAVDADDTVETASSVPQTLAPTPAPTAPTLLGKSESLWEMYTSREYIGLLVYFCLSLLQMQFYVATARQQLEQRGDEDNTYADVFSLISALSCAPFLPVVMPIVGSSNGSAIYAACTPWH